MALVSTLVRASTPDEGVQEALEGKITPADAVERAKRSANARTKT